MVSASSLDNTIISTVIRGREPGGGRPRARTMSVLQCRQTRIQFAAPDLSKLTRFADHAISRTNFESSFHNLSNIKGPMINSVLIRPSATPDISPAPQSRSITLPLAELECGVSMGWGRCPRETNDVCLKITRRCVRQLYRHAVDSQYTRWRRD